MEKRIPITTRGAQQLRAELDELKKVRRPEVVRAIAEARDKGDLSENAEYDAAKDLQGQIEGRIAELEGKMTLLQIIDPKALNAGDRIVFGATVELEDEDSGQAKTYLDFQPPGSCLNRQIRRRRDAVPGPQGRDALRHRQRALRIRSSALLRIRVVGLLRD